MKLDDLVLAADVTDNPRHPALLLLHGWPHNRRVYDTVTDAFAADFYTIVPDLPIGESIGAPRTGEKAVLADIVLTAAEELGTKNIVVTGFDVGGMIAFGSAREHGAHTRYGVSQYGLAGHRTLDEGDQQSAYLPFRLQATPELPEALATSHEREYGGFFTNFLAGRKEAVTEKHRAAFTKA